jgi:hypothetical protein
MEGRSPHVHGKKVLFGNDSKENQKEEHAIFNVSGRVEKS